MQEPVRAVQSVVVDKVICCVVNLQELHEGNRAALRAYVLGWGRMYGGLIFVEEHYTKYLRDRHEMECNTDSQSRLELRTYWISSTLAW